MTTITSASTTTTGTMTTPAGAATPTGATPDPSAGTHPSAARRVTGGAAGSTEVPPARRATAGGAGPASATESASATAPPGEPATAPGTGISADSPGIPSATPATPTTSATEAPSSTPSAPPTSPAPTGPASATPHDPCTHGFLPERPPVRSMIGTWTRLDAMARAAAVAPDREAAVALVERARRAGELSALRQRVSRLSLRNAEAAAMRIAVIAVSCGWCGLDPQAPAAREVADEAFLDLWAAIAHRIDHDQFVALPTLALHNWVPERKPRRHIPIDQLARTEVLVPIVRWAPEGQPLSRLDRLMLAATRLEAHGIWLFRLAETLAGRSPDDSSTPTALRRLVRVQHALRAQLLAEATDLTAAPATPQQRAVLGALAEQGALEPPVLQAAEAVLGIGGRRMGEGRRQLLRRHLPAQHRAWLSAMDRHCAPVRTLAHRGGPDAAVYREAQESLIALRRTYTALVQAAARPAAPPLPAAA
ncbi:hypothetical protein ACWQ06_11850 [Streptomyces angustmyceticus]|uniref:hypothetical protein n=1 Tax=Streptomyces angustmyceticus TaxID=285578 RepID=UPI0021AFCAAD|nr:hypothetical protein [Streptomyces angustmyceticus]